VSHTRRRNSSRTDKAQTFQFKIFHVAASRFSANYMKKLNYNVAPNFCSLYRFVDGYLLMFFCFQIYQHQITAVQGLAKCMGWQFLANSTHLGLGAVEPLGNASSCILASPIGDR
jgi:hypothetical protein